MKKTFCFLILFILSILSISSIAFAQQYQVGDTVTDFTLPDGSGNSVSLYDYSDNIIVIYFWSST